MCGPSPRSALIIGYWTQFVATNPARVGAHPKPFHRTQPHEKFPFTWSSTYA
jgi:hypothetical protein